MEQAASFLSGLLKKKAYVLGVRDATGKNVTGATTEVDRQIQQVLKSKEPITGTGVTKSGIED